MEKAATKEFIIGLHNVEGAQKFTPRRAIFNGVQGCIWTKRILTNGAWLYEGQQHVRKAACETEVAADFWPVDHDAQVKYWDQA